MYSTLSRKRAVVDKTNIYTKRLIGALDRCEVSDRDGVHLVSAVIEALGLNLQHYVLSHSTLHEYRRKIRKEITEEYQQNIKVFSAINDEVR